MRELISSIIILFFIMDPLGNIPVFLSVLKNVPENRRKKVMIRELVIALIVLLFFFFVGDLVMRTLHLSQQAISISGGIILFIIPIKMIFPFGEISSVDEDGNSEPLIVPLAVPCVAGPSAMAVILLLQHSPGIVMVMNLFAIIVAWIASSVLILISSVLYKILGMNGIKAVEKLMGMILVLLSVQMLLDGLRMSFVIH